MILYLGLTFTWLSGGDYHARGDEKNYLLVTESLVADGDLSLTNNLDPDKIWFEVPDGPAYDIHSFGLPLLVTPGYYLAGYAGVRLQLAFLSGFFPILAFFLLRRIVNDELWSLLFSFLIGIGFPFAVVASQVFPDLMAGLGILFVVERLLKLEDRPASRWYSWLPVAVTCGFICLLHLKFAGPAILLLIAYSIMLIRNDPSEHYWSPVILTMWGIFASFLILLGWYNLHAYGNFLGWRGGDELKNSARTALMVLGGLHWDRLHGIFLQNPLLVLGLMGLPIFLVKRRLTAAVWIMVYALLIVPHCFHFNYYGGGLFGRFQWSSIALWIIPAGYALKYLLNQHRRILYGIVLLVLFYETTFLMNALDYPSLAYEMAHLTSLGRLMTYLPLFRDPAGMVYHIQNYMVIFIGIGLLVVGITMSKESIDDPGR